MKLTGRRKAALATFVGSGSTTLIAALQSILLLPMYLRAVGTETYGVWLATGEILLWMVAFDCGIPNLMIQRIGSAHAQGRTGEIGRQFASCLAFLSVLAVALSGLLWALSPVVANLFASGSVVSADLVGPLRVAAIATGLTLVNYAFQGLARALQLTALPNVAAVLSTVAGFAVTYVLLLRGSGLQAIAIGLLVRSAGSLVGGILILLAVDGFRPARQSFRPCWVVTKDYLRETPLLLSSGIAYALMTNSQIAIANLVLGPAAAVLLSTTRRLADLIKSVLDMASYSTEGGLAHLFGTGDKPKVVRVLREIDERFFLLSFAMLAGYIAANGQFVELWTKGEFQPLPILTILLALRAFTTTWSYMGVARLRASGAFRTASAVLLGDCLFRILAMTLGAMYWGLIGLCIGSALPSIAFGFLARTRLEGTWGALPKFSVNLAATCVGVSILSVAIGFLSKPTSWVGVISLGLTVVVGSGALLFAASRRRSVPDAIPLQRAA